MGNIELYELGETVRTTQCLTSLRHSKEGTVHCVCGKCLMPLSEQTERIKNRIDIISDPLFVVKQGVRHGVVHGLAVWLNKARSHKAWERELVKYEELREHRIACSPLRRAMPVGVAIAQTRGSLSMIFILNCASEMSQMERGHVACCRV